MTISANPYREQYRRERRDYYWIVANLNGKMVIIGPKDSEVEANTFAYEKLDNVEFDIVGLPTRDRGAATREIKKRRKESRGEL